MTGYIKKNFSLFITVLLFLLMFIGGSLSYYGFFSLQVFLNLFVDNAYLMVIAVGLTFVIISGGIDISVGSLVALVCMFSARMLQMGMHPLPVILLSLCIGLMGGYLTGYVIHEFNIQPFIATLATQFLYRGLCYIISIDSIRITNDFYVAAAKFKVHLPGGMFVSVSVLVILIVTAIASLVLNKTRFGRAVYAVGGNRKSAQLMGLPVKRVTIGVYALCGFFTALGAILFSLYTLSAYGLQNIGLEMDGIAAVVIGGTLLTGGVGTIAGSIMGVLVQGLTQTIIIFQGNLSSWWTKVVVAGLLCAFVILQSYLTRRAEERKTDRISREAEPVCV